MNGYSEDLRRRVVSAVECGMSKSQAARTFSVSLSSVKRYINKADRGESLDPKKSPRSAPKLNEKASKLLEDDLQERAQDHARVSAGTDDVVGVGQHRRVENKECGDRGDIRDQEQYARNSCDCLRIDPDSFPR